VASPVFADNQQRHFGEALHGHAGEGRVLMSQAGHVRTYDPATSVVFMKTNERFGGLSNMAPGFPLRVSGIRIRTSEALYQACRFPHLPYVQQRIIDEHSPMTAKMRGKPFRKDSRPDWDAVRVKIMKWCLRVKLAHHWSTFGRLLLDTGDSPIVEQSRKDDFWGAKVGDDKKLVGMNVLGRLLMELREEIKSGIRDRSTVVLPLEIPDFLIFSQPIDPVGLGSKSVGDRLQEEQPPSDLRKRRLPVEVAQGSFFEPLPDAEDTRAADDKLAAHLEPIVSHLATKDGLRPYPKTKPSGLPWLGDVPSHWDVRRNGRLFGSRRETGFPDLPVLEVSLKSGVRIRDFDNGTRKQEIDDRSKYQRAIRGDIAYNMMRMWQGAVGIAPADGLVSPAYVVARPFPETDGAYYAYLFRTAAYMREIDVFSRGIVPDRNRLYWESFKQMPSVYPPIDEQRLIVRFLDWHGVQTAKLTRAKKRLIALLNEQKQAIAHRAVTRGLDPKVKLKPSGVPWLGDMPQGWKVERIKGLARSGYKTFVDGDWIESPYITDAGIRLIQTGNVGIGRYKEKGFRYISESTFQELRCTDIQPNDILICRLGDPVGRACLAPDLGCRMITSVDVCILKARSDLVPEFVILVMSSPRYLDWVGSLVRGSTRDRVSRSMLGSFSLAFPPANQQSEIIKAIELSTAGINAAVANASREIIFIEEFRARLIADVVTGKLDVRALAKSLPEITELDPVDEPVDDEDRDDAENEEVAA
jgi:type I restriction enzyme S subunit